MYLAIKRILDVAIALTMLLALSPIFLIIMLLLSLTGEGEVFYHQERVGFKNRRFKIWKFATMQKNSPKLGTGDVTIANDPRLIPLGAFLRKTKLNELPQLFNVLKGEMTIVGPRPLMVSGFERYSTAIQQRIYDIKPGVTGIGSVIFRDEETIVSKSDDYESTYRKINNCKGELELWYQKKMSFITDVTIIFLTVWVIIFRKSNLVYKLFPGLPHLDVAYILEPSAKEEKFIS